MASVQLSVLRDGQWVLETTYVSNVLGKKQAQPIPKQREAPKVPRCGLLTRTVVESPIFHWTLPARIRCLRLNDVAFIGDTYIQICELLPDGRLLPVAKKDDFGARIRNAKVLGTLPDEDGRDPFNARFNRDAMSMDNDDASSGRLSSGPPQVLAVTIETGHLFFLCLEQAEDGLYRFKTAAYPPPRRGPLNKPGFHMAVDPNSNYVALASHEGTLVIHRVAHGNGAYRQLDGHTLIQGSVTHVMKDTIIHKMEFLYPHPDDEDHVILLLVVIRGHRTRLLLYEWEVGEDVDNVLSVGERSHRLPDQWDMPLLLIPLTVRQAFLLVCKDSIAACKDILYGPPTCEPVNFDTPPTSVLHYGEGPPLWSAWARPFRLASWMAKKDSIYLAREDGSIVYLEIDANNILDLSVRVLDHQCHISTAFAAMYDQFTDILLVGGDQGPGAVWQVPPRLDPVKLQTLPNWSPVRDFTTTDVFRTWNQEIGTDNSRMVPWSEDHGMNITEPSRIFATSGRGIQGAVCEYRYGFRASIGLDMDFDLPSRECWVLPSDTSRSDAHGYDVLISLFSFSAALRIAPGLDSVHALDQDTCGFDLSSRTILADVLRVSGSATNAAAAVVQITEHSVTVLAPSATPLRQSFADMPGFEGSQIDYASMLGDTVAVSSFDSGKSIIYVIRVCCEPSVQLELVTSISVDGEVTCMTLSERDGTGVVLACVMRGSTQVIQPYLVVGTGAREQPLTPFPIGPDNIDEAFQGELEALTSIAEFSGPARQNALVCGSRSGHVLVVSGASEGDVRSRQTYTIHVEKISRTKNTVSVARAPDGSAVALVCSDDGLVMMKDLAPSTRKKAAHFKAIHRVLLADENNRNLQLPPPHAVAITDRQFSDEPGHIPAFFLVKGHVLAANISLAAGPVYRYMPTEGTPTRILHSAKLNALVVAVQRAGKSALLFIDPDTGEDLSKPQDKDGNDVASISGLNGRGQQIFGLYEWLFRSANSTWQFIVVSTTNTLVIVSVEQLLSKPGTTPPVPRRIRFWTRFKLRNFENPVFSVVAEGDSLVFASGCMVQKNVLDMAEKRLKPISHVVLDSEVVSLRLVNGKIYALTSRHSLFILDPRDDQAAAPTGSAVAATSLMQVLHLDTSERWGSHQIELANCSPADLKNIGTKDNVDNDNGDDESDGAKSSTQTDINDQIITLVSDIDCGVFGLWVPRRQPGRELEVVFEAELPYSVRKFRRGLTRPLWTRWRRRSRYGVRLATLDGAEILGVGLDGSLRHFMLVDVPLWRLLRFIHDAAMLSPDFCPMADRIDGLGGRIPAEPSIAAALDRDHFRGDLEEIHPGWMHVDGDLINRVYQASKLEQVIPKSHYGQFKRLLDDIDQGAHTADIEQSDDPEELGDYLEFAYEILEHLFEVPF